ncbi:MAG: tyrosine-type recombinase/integrase [Desulfosporosinus sp.]|nr:tyrosine-type recombinase/integrase [Desulfosporosinus sp.]
MAKIRLKANLGQSDSIQMETAFDEFIRYSKAKNLAPITLTNYQREFKSFHFFYNGSIQDISGDTVIQYIEYLQKRDIVTATVNTALRHLRAILNYWAEQNYCKPVRIKLLRFNEEIKDTYTDEEISRLLKKPDVKTASFREYRTWAVINFFIGTGCRLSTLTAIRIGDIDWDNELIAYTHTKNKKAQYTPLSRHMAVVLREYISYRGGEDTDLLFPSESNTKLVGTSVAHDIAKYNIKRGVEKTSAHLFRHTFAKNWIIEGGDPLRLQKILGHSTLAMSQHYANLYKQDLKAGFEDFNLLSRLKTDDKIRMGKLNSRGTRK